MGTGTRDASGSDKMWVDGLADYENKLIKEIYTGIAL